MKGLVFKDINQIELQEIEKPMIEKETDAIIRITMTTICGSDIHLYHGHMQTTPGYTLGHEYVGIVEEVGGAVKSLKKGDRVIGPAAPFCGWRTLTRKRKRKSRKVVSRSRTSTSAL